MRKWYLITMLGGLLIAPLSVGQGNIQLLDAWNRYFNEAYFAYSLPKNTEIRYESSDEPNIAVTDKVDHFVIAFNSKYNLGSSLERVILLHEDCHIEQWGEKLTHGPAWKGCMRRLSKLGAFDNLLFEELQ